MILLALACTDPPSKADDTAIAAACPDPPDLLGAFTRGIDGAADACDIAALTAWVDAKELELGPWRQEVRRAFSTDEAVFEPVEGDPAVAPAGVPEAVIADDGRTFLYYVDGDIDRVPTLAADGEGWMRTRGVPGLGALALSTSTDGVTFTREDAFTVEGLTTGMVVDPDILRAPDGTWRMYYVAMAMEDYLQRYTWQEGEAHDVWMAESTDLIHWVQRPEPVVHGPFADPSVYCFTAETCSMASFGLDWSTSADGGETFEYHGAWQAPGFAPEFAPLADGTLRIYYNSKELGAPLWSLHSADGMDWTREETLRLDAYGEAVTIVPSPAGGWNLYYHTFSNPDDLPV